ncbi:hypothetical protein BP00DRAFT_454986 [Aspergillus indologenus CBS 114.80]|uniref:Uncharacterized protein n=1 Tax=Aspergillus indologenus CBS 114.80 TaxID=1450541 RepID=A0A2V5IBL9_9EURO|nr:hypothetical protein BP00DRAFT_454986 [Aspergillus indologenus CBS 114.80]
MPAVQSTPNTPQNNDSQKHRCFFQPPQSNNPTTTFRILSDPHLKITQQYLTHDVPASAQNLLLADYEPYRAFLQNQTTRFARVLLVPSNHEFHGGNRSGGPRVKPTPRTGRGAVLPRPANGPAPAQLRDPIRVVDVVDKNHAKSPRFPEEIHGWTVEAHNAAYAAESRDEMRAVQLQEQQQQQQQQQQQAAANIPDSVQEPPRCSWW